MSVVNNVDMHTYAKIDQIANGLMDRQTHTMIILPLVCGEIALGKNICLRLSQTKI